MKYLVFSADYHAEHCLRHEFTGESVSRDVALPEALKERIKNWNERYYKIIGGDDDNLQSKLNIISFLDSEGIEIVKSIEMASTERIKVKYYSEGRMRHLVVQS